jgi:hypothetical protein
LTLHLYFTLNFSTIGKGGKNRRRGKGDGEESKRELEFKEDGTLQQIPNFSSAFDILRIPGRRRVCLCLCTVTQNKTTPLHTSLSTLRLYDYKNVINFIRDSGEYKKATLFVEKYT